MRLVYARLLLSALAATTAARASEVAYKIDTVAGSDWVGDNGAATNAILLQAEGIAADLNGNLYIADAADHRVRKVTPAGIISTVAGTGVQGFSGDGGPAVAAQINSPYGLAFDGGGNLYIADLGNARVRRVAPDGTILTVAGGDATLISLVAPRNLALDGHGSLYISDFSAHRVYRLSPDGSLSPVAGTGVRGFSGDGAPAALARLAYPAGLAVDSQGALYVADSQNHVVRKVANGVISSFAHTVEPTGIAVDAFDSLYIADPSAGQILLMPVSRPAIVVAVKARDLTLARGGYLYAVDGDVTRQISFVGAPHTIVAGGGSLAHGDGGAATRARLNHPSGVAADSSGNVYIADRDNHRIRRVAADGTITTIAGTGVPGNRGDGGLASQAQLNSPSAVSVDAAGNLYIADTGNQRIRKVTPAGLIRPVTSTGLVSPAYAVGGRDGSVYIADGVQGTIYKVSAAGAITTLLVNLQSPRGLTLDAAGALYFTEAGGQRVRRLDPSGDLTSLGDGQWSVPRGIAVSDTGGVLVADTGLQRILRIDASGQAVPVAGKGLAGFAGDGGPALSAGLSFPWDVGSGPGGALYIADLSNNRIRVLTPGPAGVVAPVQSVTAVNAASLQPGPVAPGMLLALRGTGLTAPDVSHTQVRFNAGSLNTILTPILAADDTQLLLQAPRQIAGLPSVQIEILRDLNTLAQIPVTVVAAAPALFTDASGRASANNEDGTINSAMNPAPRGSVIVLYGTGEGVSGLPVAVRIGDYPADVLYAGPVAGYPGLLQINARVPAGYVAPGNLSVTITAGQARSQPGVTVAVN